mgnify:CR=1 FL=1
MTYIQSLDFLQYKIMAMDIETQVMLLNETLESISELSKQNPQFKSFVNNLFKNNTCFIDNDSHKLLEFMVSTFEISNTDMIKRIQSGGAPVDDEVAPVNNDNAMVLVNNDNAMGPVNNDNVMVPGNNANAMGPGNNAQFVTQQPDNSLTIIGNILNNTHLSAENQAAMIKILGDKVSADNKLIEAQAKGIETQSAILINTTNNAIRNDRWDRTFEGLGYAFAFTTPAALMYFLQDCLDKIAVQTVTGAGHAAAGLAGAAELAARNTVPFLINKAVDLGSMTKEYLPDIIKQWGVFVRDSSAAGFATDAVGEKIIVGAVSGITEGAESAILFGSIFLYIALTLFFCILMLTIAKLRKINKIAFRIPFTEIAIQTTEKGGRKRKTKRKTKKNKNIRKKTRKRHNNKK